MENGLPSPEVKRLKYVIDLYKKYPYESHQSVQWIYTDINKNK